MMTDGVFIQAKAKGESAFVSRAANPASFDWRLQCATKGRGKSMTEKWMLRDLIAKKRNKMQPSNRMQPQNVNIV
jgi:hypothetical protein